jgi:hypothetical protein
MGMLKDMALSFSDCSISSGAVRILISMKSPSFGNVAFVFYNYSVSPEKTQQRAISLWTFFPDASRRANFLCTFPPPQSGGTFS